MHTSIEERVAVSEPLGFTSQREQCFYKLLIQVNARYDSSRTSTTNWYNEQQCTGMAYSKLVSTSFLLRGCYKVEPLNTSSATFHHGIIRALSAVTGHRGRTPPRVMVGCFGTGRCRASTSPWRSPYKDTDIPDNESLSQYIMKQFPSYGNNIAMIDATTERTLTYAQLTDQVVKAASALAKKGYKKGDVATIFSPNCPEFAIFYLAWASIGGIVSAVNNLYTPGLYLHGQLAKIYVAAELQRALSHSSSKVVVTVPSLADTVREALKTCPEVKETVVFGEADGFKPFTTLMEDDGTAFPENIDIYPKDDLAALPYSSGTTGMPKGVMLTHHNILSDVQILRSPEVDYVNTSDSIIAILPMFHIYGQVPITLATLAAGAKLITLPKFDAEVYLESVQKHQATYMHVVPPMLLFLANHPIVDKYDFSSVHSILCGAAPAGTDIIKKVCSRVNVPNFRQGFGITEASSVTHLNPKVGFKYHTCGPLIPNTEHRVVSTEDGKDCGVNEEGEVLLRGPQIMKGYFKNPQATAETITEDGWLHSGDIGYVDEDGHLVISDRLKELIKFKGFQVAPAELEHLLVSHPEILDAAVIGKPNEKVGEQPRAYIVPKSGSNLTDEDVHNFLEGKIADFKKLSGGVEFRDSIPKSASGKILRRELKAELLDSTKEK